MTVLTSGSGCLTGQPHRAGTAADARTAVSWSYALLTGDEQLPRGRLSAFAAGFDLAAAGAVCGSGDLDVPDVADPRPPVQSCQTHQDELTRDRALAYGCNPPANTIIFRRP